MKWVTGESTLFSLSVVEDSSSCLFSSRSPLDVNWYSGDNSLPICNSLYSSTINPLYPGINCRIVLPYISATPAIPPNLSVLHLLFSFSSLYSPCNTWSPCKFQDSSQSYWRPAEPSPDIWRLNRKSCHLSSLQATELCVTWWPGAGEGAKGQHEIHLSEGTWAEAIVWTKLIISFVFRRIFMSNKKGINSKILLQIHWRKKEYIPAPGSIITSVMQWRIHLSHRQLCSPLVLCFCIHLLKLNKSGEEWRIHDHNNNMARHE